MLYLFGCGDVNGALLLNSKFVPLFSIFPRRVSTLRPHSLSFRERAGPKRAHVSVCVQFHFTSYHFFCRFIHPNVSSAFRTKKRFVMHFCFVVFKSATIYLSVNWIFLHRHLFDGRSFLECIFLNCIQLAFLSPLFVFKSNLSKRRKWRDFDSLDRKSHCSL